MKVKLAAPSLRFLADLYLERADSSGKRKEAQYKCDCRPQMPPHPNPSRVHEYFLGCREVANNLGFVTEDG